MRRSAVGCALLATAAGYTLDGSAPFWERVDRDRGCSHEKDCGFTGITPEQCRARGCCWDPTGTRNWCSGTAVKCDASHPCDHGTCKDGACACDAGWSGFWCNQTTIKTVHVVQSCHLDAGFTDSTAGVINKYFTSYIPNAVATGKALRSNTSAPAGHRLRFMFQTFILSLYMDCPTGMGLRCPSESSKAALRESAQAGDITFHAFPHNAELENTSPLMLEEGLKLSARVAEALGVASPRFLSVRDVPGAPRGAIPIMRKNNITVLTVGVNGASMYPRVPKIFRWIDPVSNESVVAMWHPRGYGGYSTGEAVTLPSSSHALVTDWIGDNQGPGDVNHYKGLFQKLQGEFPNAQIVASTFDNFTDQVAAEGALDDLPVVDSEVGDSWIYGVPSDARKVSRARSVLRAWDRYAASGGARDAAYLNATRIAIKNCEHTWGRDVKSTLSDDTNWENKAFEHARTQGLVKSQYQRLQDSWWEQRVWTDYAHEALPAGHPLRGLLEEELATVIQAVPDPAAEGFTKVAAAGSFDCGDTTVAYDAKTGAVTGLVDNVNSVSWAAPDSPLLDFTYRTYSQAEFQQFQNNYANLTNPPGWFRKDFGKPGNEYSQAGLWHGGLDELWVKKEANQTSFITRTRIVDDNGSSTFAHEEYGAPDHFLTLMTVPHKATAASPRATVTVWCVNKTATRNPESMYMSFKPSGEGVWEMHKLGQWQPTGNVVAGGSQHLHGVQAGFRFTKGSSRLTVEVVDTPVINLGKPLGFPVPATKGPDPWDVKPDLATYGVSSMLWNNLWGTNYVQWYPFYKDYAPVKGEENFISRYSLWF